jgi:hypothetical protein
VKQNKILKNMEGNKKGYIIKLEKYIGGGGNICPSPNLMSRKCKENCRN